MTLWLSGQQTCGVEAGLKHKSPCSLGRGQPSCTSSCTHSLLVGRREHLLLSLLLMAEAHSQVLWTLTPVAPELLEKLALFVQPGRCSSCVRHPQDPEGMS